jgi:hypothetical protein
MPAYGRAAQRASATLFLIQPRLSGDVLRRRALLPGGREWHILQKIPYRHRYSGSLSLHELFVYF